MCVFTLSPFFPDLSAWNVAFSIENYVCRLLISCSLSLCFFLQDALSRFPRGAILIKSSETELLGRITGIIREAPKVVTHQQLSFFRVDAHTCRASSARSYFNYQVVSRSRRRQVKSVMKSLTNTEEGGYYPASTPQRRSTSPAARQLAGSVV